MAINVTFYQFAKRTNSTLRPGSGTVFSCEINANCNIIAPRIELTGTGNPSAYNYCYITDFARYYFVKAWTWAPGKWVADLAVDALATFRDQIGSSTEYVLRSSARYDGTISDGLYPASAEMQSSTTAFEGGFSETIRDGFFVLGFISKNANSIGAITYVVMTPGNAKRLSSSLLTDVSYLDIDNQEISDSLTKVLFNPYQYIVSCVYFPFDSAELTAHLPLVSAVGVGWWSIDVPCWIIGEDNNLLTSQASVTIPKHPQAASRGSYCNSTPYSNYTIYYQPYGVIPLDPARLWDASSLSLQTTVDLFTGDAVLRIFTNTGQLIHESTNKLAVNIQLANISMEIPSGVGGLAQTGAAALFGGIKTALSGGSITDVGSGILNAAQATNADVSSKGATGSTIAFDMSPYLVSRFQMLVDDNNEDHGRPLCKRVQLSTIPGYIMVDDPDIALQATAEEINAIKQFMAGGFFYE